MQWSDSIAPSKGTTRTALWVKRAVMAAVVIELAWVVVVNSALQLPLTQALVNAIRPEKFQVSWEQAWSWYPARVHVVGAFANGQSRSQQWQFEAASVSGSIDLLPLIFKRVWVSNVIATDVDYRQRPRLRPDRDYADIMPFFPDIEGWEMTDAVTSPRKRRAWRIAVDDIHVSGNHSYWIMNLQGAGAGHVAANLTYDTRDRVFSLDAHDLALELDAVHINGDHEMFRRGSIRGSLGFTPFTPSEHKDISLLGFLVLDAEMDFDVNSLAFISLFTLNFGGTTVDGSGRAEGVLRLDQGVVLPGTDLSVDADDLRVRVLDHSISGSGQVALKLGPETDQRMNLGFDFRDLEVVPDQELRPTLTGQSLELTMEGDGRLLPEPEKRNESHTIGMKVERLAVPNLAALQRYLPQKWPIELYGGEGYLHGAARFSPTMLAMDLSLESERADMGIHSYRFETNLDAALKLDNPSIMTGATNVDGSYIRLSESKLENAGLEDVEPWAAYLEIEEGQLSLFHDAERQRQEDLVDLFELLAAAEVRQLFSDSSALLRLRAEVSSLAWIAVLLGKEYDIDVSGSSTISGDLVLDAGLPAGGTNVDVRSERLAVQFLDYVSRGDGVVSFRVEEGRTDPDWLVAIELNDADTTRRGESDAFLEDVAMTVHAVLENMNFSQRERRFSVVYKVLAAQVNDMSTFNHLLPPDSPLRISGGTATLAADIALHHDDADGWLRLHSSGLQAEADTQSVTGDLAVELRLAGGVPPQRFFDITGSVIDLTHVRVAGDFGEFDQEDWSARLVLTRGGTLLTDPPRMDLEARLRMSDSRPIVAMFRNQDGWRPEFLTGMMTVEDIEGTAQMAMANERVVIPLAHATSDNIEVSAKGVIAGETRDGVIYFRYKDAEALLKIRGGRKSLAIFGVRKKFDDYRIPQL
jgi:hypothetical protein